MIGLTIEFDTTPDQTNSAIDEEIILYIQKVKESQGVRKIDLKLIHSFFKKIKVFQIKFREFWMYNKKFLPKLFKMAKRYCFICSTSVASECAFSVAGFINRKERSSLKPRTLRFLILTKQVEKLSKILC